MARPDRVRTVAAVRRREGEPDAPHGWSRNPSAGQITVIAKQGADVQATRDLGVDLQRRVDAIAAATGTQAAVGGPAGELGDFTTETTSRILAVVIALAVALALLLMVMLRAVALPLAAIAFDLLVTAATFGVMELLFAGDDPLFGRFGPRRPDVDRRAPRAAARGGGAARAPRLVADQAQRAATTDPRDPRDHAEGGHRCRGLTAPSRCARCRLPRWPSSASRRLSAPTPTARC